MRRGSESNMKDGELRLILRVYLKKEEEFFGAGPAKFLRLVGVTGSMNAACKAMYMSYSKGWKLINRVERELGYKVLERNAGGGGGGGSELTEEGERFLRCYTEMENDLEAAARQIFLKYFGS